MMKTIGAFLAVLATANADVYMHNPRGSNNRLNEANANRNNGNRLFDSQNNNRGGYNVGDKTNAAFNTNTNGAAATEGSPAGGEQRISWVDGALDKDQYAMQYMEGSKLGIEWTNQHGCGGNEKTNSHKLNCNIVMQFTCNTDNTVQTEPALQVMIKDGRNTNAPDTANSMSDARNAQITQNDNNGRGRHESEAWYFECTKRQRDINLFTADQKLNGVQSIYTRQNPNGGRRGLECPEERDYYPYWNPTPFMDIAYLTSNTEDCEPESTYGTLNIGGNSQNGKEIERCSYTPAGGTGVDGVWEDVAEVRTAEACAALKANPPAGATAGEINWTGYSHGLTEPVCKQGAWSRDNHLGNSVNGQTLSYNWTLPTVSISSSNGVGKNAMIYTNEVAKCLLRIRYNISTDDYDVRNTDATSNKQANQGIESPIENNPTVNVKAALQGLRLAINTNQFGRTFQDRSHAFYLKKRSTAAAVAGAIINLNVRGKRGNIVQTFPSTEYDFTPNHVHVDSGDVLHVQWTGSNTHNNGNPAGDGQAGDAGEGTGGTDRHNMIGIPNKDQNFPIALDKETHSDVNFVQQMDCFNSAGDELTTVDCAVALASSNYFKDKGEAQAGGTALSQTLDNAYASLHGGIFLKTKKAGEYAYMCTRNNNFTNRSQKGVMVVEEK